MTVSEEVRGEELGGKGEERMFVSREQHTTRAP